MLVTKEQQGAKNKENFLKLVSEHDPSTLKKVKWRIRNRWWIRPLQKIQIKLLILKDKFTNQA
jgi:hypothetical protein